jgi:hypothetical protein
VFGSRSRRVRSPSEVGSVNGPARDTSHDTLDLAQYVLRPWRQRRTPATGLHSAAGSTGLLRPRTPDTRLSNRDRCRGASEAVSPPRGGSSCDSRAPWHSPARTCLAGPRPRLGARLSLRSTSVRQRRTSAPHGGYRHMSRFAGRQRQLKVGSSALASESYRLRRTRRTRAATGGSTRTPRGRTQLICLLRPTLGQGLDVLDEALDLLRRQVGGRLPGSRATQAKLTRRSSAELAPAQRPSVGERPYLRRLARDDEESQCPGPPRNDLLTSARRARSLPGSPCRSRRRRGILPDLLPARS